MALNRETGAAPTKMKITRTTKTISQAELDEKERARKERAFQKLMLEKYGKMKKEQKTIEKKGRGGSF